MYVSQSISVSASTRIGQIFLGTLEVNGSLTWHKTDYELRQDGIARDNKASQRRKVRRIRQK